MKSLDSVPVRQPGRPSFQGVGFWSLGNPKITKRAALNRGTALNSGTVRPPRPAIGQEPRYR